MIRKIGQIAPDTIQSFRMPIRYAQKLANDLLVNAYDPLFTLNLGSKWSSTLNCQTFTRSAIEFLGFQLSENVQVISDCLPMIFDIYLRTCLMTATASQRTKK